MGLCLCTTYTPLALLLVNLTQARSCGPALLMAVLLLLPLLLLTILLAGTPPPPTFACRREALRFRRGMEEATDQLGHVTADNASLKAQLEAAATELAAIEEYASKR